MRKILNGFLTTLVIVATATCCYSQKVNVVGPSIELNNDLFVSAATQFVFQKADILIEYSIDNGKWSRYEKPFSITETGSHTIAYRIINGEHGAPETRLSVVVDTSKPVINAALIYKSIVLKKFEAGKDVKIDEKRIQCGIGSEIHAQAIDTDSGLKSIQFRQDNAPLQPFDEPVRLHGRGKHTYTIVAKDFVDNTTESMIVLEVLE